MGAGRPRKEIDKKTFENLCAIQCTKEDICDVMEISEKTLNAWCKREYGENFSLVFKKKRTGGKISLRRAGFKHALNGNSSVLIFMLKNICGMSDNPQEAIDTEDSGAYFEAAGLDDNANA